jgi:hypothetical protein
VYERNLMHLGSVYHTPTCSGMHGVGRIHFSGRLSCWVAIAASVCQRLTNEQMFSFVRSARLHLTRWMLYSAAYGHLWRFGLLTTVETHDLSMCECFRAGDRAYLYSGCETCHQTSAGSH